MFNITSWIKPATPLALPLPTPCIYSVAFMDSSEISRGGGGGGGWKQREGHNFSRLRKGRGHEKWVVKRGRVMQIYVRDHVRDMCVIM